MRILVAHNHYTAHGGEDTVFAAEVALLEANGHAVIVYEDDNRRIASMNRAAVATGAIWSRDSRRKFASLIAKENPDIAHFHNTFPLISPSVYFACQKADIPVVQTLHNYRLVCPGTYLLRDGAVCEKCIGKSFKWPAIVHACYRDSRLQSGNVATMLVWHSWLKTWTETVSGYIALTEFSKGKFVADGLPANKIFVKPNFIAAEPTADQSGKGAYLLFIGRLTEEKGIRVLLDALTQAKPAPLKIIGDGPLAGLIDEQIQKHGLSQVERLGQLPYDEVQSYLNAATALVLPSIWYEGFPMTIVEAFSRGVPVIASRLGSLAEIVEDKINGLLFSSGDATELAERIDWAGSNRPALRALGENAHRTFVEKYSSQSNYEMLMQIYQTVLNRQD